MFEVNFNPFCDFHPFDFLFLGFPYVEIVDKMVDSIFMQKVAIQPFRKYSDQSQFLLDHGQRPFLHKHWLRGFG